MSVLFFSRIVLDWDILIFKIIFLWIIQKIFIYTNLVGLNFIQIRINF